MKRRDLNGRGPAKLPSRADRLAAELEAAKLRIEQLRMLCSGAVELKIAVRDALCFFDRAAASQTEWTAADVRRLQQLRAIALVIVHFTQSASHRIFRFFFKA